MTHLKTKDFTTKYSSELSHNVWFSLISTISRFLKKKTKKGEKKLQNKQTFLFLCRVSINVYKLRS